MDTMIPLFPGYDITITARRLTADTQIEAQLQQYIELIYRSPRPRDWVIAMWNTHFRSVQDYCLWRSSNPDVLPGIMQPLRARAEWLAPLFVSLSTL